MRAIVLSSALIAVIGLSACNKPSEDAPSLKVDSAAAAEAAPYAKADAAADEAAAPAEETAEAAAPAPQAGSRSYTPVPVSAEDQPGRARRIRCQIGNDPEVGCTFTPLFGDGSFQLDGPDIALRMVISDGEGSLFEVIGPERRVPIGGLYYRDKRDRACWVSQDDTPAPSRVCAR